MDMEDNACNAGPESAVLICSDQEANTSDRKPMQKYLLLGGIAVALLGTVVILLVLFCGRRTSFKTTSELSFAAAEALQAGDDQRLFKMTELSEKFLESNPGLLGEGDLPEDIMRTYYAGLAGPFSARLRAAYGENCYLMPWFESIERTGTDAETGNLAFGLEAEEYMEKYGFFTVDGEVVADAYIMMAKLNGRWKLIIVTLQDETND